MKDFRMQLTAKLLRASNTHGEDMPYWMWEYDEEVLPFIRKLKSLGFKSTGTGFVSIYFKKRSEENDWTFTVVIYNPKIDPLGGTLEKPVPIVGYVQAIDNDDRTFDSVESMVETIEDVQRDYYYSSGYDPESKISSNSRSPVVEKFLKKYERYKDLYSQAARVVRKELERELEKSGIRAAITSRSKKVDSLKRKLLERNSKRPYTDTKSILSDVKDMAGVRVALYFPIDRKPVEEIIERLYKQVRPPKHFPEEGEPGDGGYVATHFAIDFSGLVIEIQVASALIFAWSEVNHDIVYKPLYGNPTPEEKHLLDQLLTIVLKGEDTVLSLQEVLSNKKAYSSKVAGYVAKIILKREKILAGK